MQLLLVCGVKLATESVHLHPMDIKHDTVYDFNSDQFVSFHWLYDSFLFPFYVSLLCFVILNKPDKYILIFKHFMHNATLFYFYWL